MARWHWVGWRKNGTTDGVTFEDSISIDSPGDYYFVARAKVDQIYKDVIHPEEYGNESYLRVIQERTNESFYEEIDGVDGLRVVEGQLWWYSPVIDVQIGVEWLDGWPYRKQITINHDVISEDLTNFPVLISLDSDADLALYAQEDGADIVFTDSTRKYGVTT